MKSPYEYPDDKRFVFAADDWLISYADQCLNSRSPYVLAFSFAICLELYLKAYYTKITNNAIKATEFSHNIKKIIQKIKELDGDKFPHSLNFKFHLLEHDLWELDKQSWQSEWFNNLPAEDKFELRENLELYLAMAYNADLKYGISPCLERHNGRIISSSWGSHNKRLADIIVAIRKRIHYSESEIFDRLECASRDQRMTQFARDYLSDIFTRSNNNSTD